MITGISQEAHDLASKLRGQFTISGTVEELARTIDASLPIPERTPMKTGITTDKGRDVFLLDGQPVYLGGMNQNDDGIINQLARRLGEERMTTYRADTVAMNANIMRVMPVFPDRYPGQPDNIITYDLSWLMMKGARVPLSYYEWGTVATTEYELVDWQDFMDFYQQATAALQIVCFDGGPKSALSQLGIDRVQLNSAEFLSSAAVWDHLRRGLELMMGPYASDPNILWSIFNEPHNWRWFWHHNPVTGKIEYNTAAYDSFNAELHQFVKVELGVKGMVSLGEWAHTTVGFHAPPFGYVDKPPLISTTALGLWDYWEAHAYGPVNVLIEALNWAMARAGANVGPLLVSEMAFRGTPAVDLSSSFERLLSVFPRLNFIPWGIQWPGEEPALAINLNYPETADTARRLATFWQSRRESGAAFGVTSTAMAVKPTSVTTGRPSDAAIRALMGREA